MERLDEHIHGSYAGILADLKAQHAEYFFDAEHFGNELDTYVNPKMRIMFIRDRGVEFVQLFPIQHPGDLFSLQFLVEMVAPYENGGGFEGFASLPMCVDRIYAMFESAYYPCYRRAYRVYESCRNEME